jgi:hypothetical protein
MRGASDARFFEADMRDPSAIDVAIRPRSSGARIAVHGLATPQEAAAMMAASACRMV